MKWCDPTDKSDPVISPQAEIGVFLRKHGDVPGFRVNEHFLMLQTSHDLETLRNHLRVKAENFPLPTFLGNRPLFVMEEDPPISILEKAFGAPAAADAVEVAIAMGARKLFLFGLCGGVGEDVNVGDVIVPSEIKREEGTSYHYLSNSEPVTPDARLAESLFQFLREQGDMRVHSGRTVSTDAVFRQTLMKERRWRQEGILGIDMEMSAMLAVARFHGLPAVSLLVASDKHVLDGKSTWHWGGQELATSRGRALKLFVRFIGTAKTHNIAAAGDGEKARRS